MDFFGFFLMTEPATEHLVSCANALGHPFSSQAPAYGPGVKAITATLVLSRAAPGRRSRQTKPRYSPGVREIKAHGLTARVEDTLEFSIRPPFDQLLRASSEAELAAALLPALKELAPSLLELRIPEFDGQRFIADLESFLQGAAVRGAYVH
jgi:hypothetical protein